MKRFLTILILLITGITAFPQLNTNHYYYVGRSRIYFKNYVGAIENFNIVIKLKPHMPQPYFLRGVAKHYLEDFRGAKADYDKALEIKPFYPEAYMQRGMANHELKNFEEALSDYSNALKLNSDDAGIYNNRGITKVAMEDLDGGIKDYTKAIKLKPGMTTAYLNRSSAKQMKDDFDGAIKDCNAAIKIRPHFAGAYLMRGIAHYEKKDFAAALKDYDICIRLDSRVSQAFVNRGLVKHQLGDYQGAIMDYDMAIELNPSTAVAWLNRGIAKESLGVSGYRKDYATAEELDPRFAEKRERIEEEYRKQQQQRYYASAQTKKNTNKSNTNTQNSSASNSANSNATADNSQKKPKKRGPITRKRKKRHIIVNEEGEVTETEITDGRIQNRNVKIELQPDFTISMFHKDSVDYDKLQYYNMEIDALNRKNNNNPFLVISNKQSKIISWQIDEYSKKIAWQNEFISNNKKLSRGYFNRAVYYDLLNDFNKSIADFDKVIKSDERAIMKYFSNASKPSNTKLNNAFTTTILSYFGRAVTRMKMSDYIQSLNTLPEPSTLAINGISSPDEENNKAETNLDYEEIMDDYERVVFMNPRFIFGWFNMANIKVKKRDYIGAINDYTKAIEVEPDYAEAYYNRGLTRIYLDDLENGAIDLSKAGELGIEEAYNVIKRYCNQ